MPSMITEPAQEPLVSAPIRRGLEALDEWRFAALPFFEITPLTEAEAFVGQSVFGRAGGLVLSRVRFSSQRMEHDPSKLRGVDHNYLLFERYRSGCGRGLVDGNATTISDGGMHLVDMSRHYVTIANVQRADGVLIPHDAVGYDPSRHSAYFPLPEHSQDGHTLANGVVSLEAAVANRRAEDASDVASAFCGLIRALLLGETDDLDQEARRGRKLLLHGYVERHLQDDDLTAERLCRDLAMSRATLYRSLEDEGGVRSFVNGLRLEQCFAELLQATAQRGQVRVVAERWGFHDAASFHRSFRRRFGFAPSDCLGSDTPGSDTGPDDIAQLFPDPLADWFRTG